MSGEARGRIRSLVPFPVRFLVLVRFLVSLSVLWPLGAAAFASASDSEGTRPSGREDGNLNVAAINHLIDGPPAPEAPAVMTRDESGRVTLRAVRVEEPLTLDGQLDERVYRDVPAIEGFVQQEPNEGSPATERTEIWILYDRANVYVSARLWDSQPERAIANEMRRDNRNIFGNENFAIILDTFYDRRNGFMFQTNPLGAL